MIDALNNSGFDRNNCEHIFVSLGDLLDRGPDPIKCLEFVNSLPEDRRILVRGNHEDLMEEMIARSLLVSVDNAHANHPNHPEVSDASTSVLLNEGIVIKYNANQTYTTDGLSAALLKNIVKEANIPFQDFTNRSDLRGGSTLGNLSNNQISINSVDIGIAQLAMHSSNELCGLKDVDRMSQLMKEFFSSKIEIKSL